MAGLEFNTAAQQTTIMDQKAYDNVRAIGINPQDLTSVNVNGKNVVWGANLDPVGMETRQLSLSYSSGTGATRTVGIEQNSDGTVNLMVDGKTVNRLNGEDLAMVKSTLAPDGVLAGEFKAMLAAGHDQGGNRLNGTQPLMGSLNADNPFFKLNLGIDIAQNGDNRPTFSPRNTLPRAEMNAPSGM